MDALRAMALFNLLVGRAAKYQDKRYAREAAAGQITPDRSLVQFPRNALTRPAASQHCYQFEAVKALEAAGVFLFRILSVAGASRSVTPGSSMTNALRDEAITAAFLGRGNTPSKPGQVTAVGAAKLTPSMPSSSSVKESIQIISLARQEHGTKRCPCYEP